MQRVLNHLLDRPLAVGVVLLSVPAIAFSGLAGLAIIAAVTGELWRQAFLFVFLIPAVVVPPVTWLHLWSWRRARRSERELARFFASTGALLGIGDLNGRFIRLSPSWERLLGFTPIEMSAVHFTEFVHPDDAERTMREVTLMAGGRHQINNFVNRFRHKNGGYCWLQWNATADVRRGLIYATAVDITARVEAETFKDSVISTVNHEIRTPLASLFAAIKIATGMQDTPLPGQTRRMLEIAENNAERLVRIIDDMLDLERIQTGTVEFRLEPRDPGGLIETAAEQNRFMYEDADVELVTVDRAHGSQVLVDEMRVQQVLGNLLSNAVKFAPRGSTVHVTADLDGDGVCLRVSDQGPGILPADRERIFDRFFQSGDHNQGGSGLGLAISKTLVEGMNGVIGLEPNQGAGATFYVLFPQYRAPAPEIVRSDSAD